MQIRRFLLLCGVLGTIELGFGCQLSEFMCDTGYCVALDKFCNGNDDCGDKSDEPPYCSRKSFSYLHYNGHVCNYLIIKFPWNNKPRQFRIESEFCARSATNFLIHTHKTDYNIHNRKWFPKLCRDFTSPCLRWIPILSNITHTCQP